MTELYNHNPFKNDLYFTLLLPWPYSDLNPNQSRRNHWSVRSTAFREAKADTHWSIREQHRGLEWHYGGDPLKALVFFWPPDNRIRDNDNYGSMMKPYQDAIFEYLKMNDSIIVSTTYQQMPTLPPGQVLYCLLEYDSFVWQNVQSTIETVSSIVGSR